MCGRCIKKKYLIKTAMFNYIFISYDAVQEFAADRFFQSAEFAQSKQLCSILKGDSSNWEHQRICCWCNDKRGVFFYTENIDKKRGILFDLTTFSGFNEKNDVTIVNIFQKVMKYGVKYFNGLPLVSCERNFDEKLTLVYPFPFVRQKDVDKVYIDKNTSGQNRADQNYLTVFHYGTGESMSPSFTCLNKVVKELRIGNFPTVQKKQGGINSFNVTSLDEEKRILTIDERVGVETWMKYLTNVQLDFIKREIVGAERIEGAAGTGKTISMVLRCVYLLTRCVTTPDDYHIIFITHSVASRDRIIESFKANCENADDYIETDEKKPRRSILITTLQEWSGKNLGTNTIEDAEYLDKDAADSKIYQYMYIQQAIGEVMNTKWNGYSVLCSEKFKHFLEASSDETKTEMFRYEISVIIKGRAEGKFDKYNELNRPRLCLPLETEEDRMFAYDVYESYQHSLESIGQFDSDDITLSALGQLNTPIWRRRSVRDGYDACFVDETQLFNLNELSVFHYLNKPQNVSKIVYAIDKSQAFGEIGFTDEELSLLLNNGEVTGADSSFNTIFRSSPEIVDLAFNILAANTAIFHNYDNPVDHCSYSFTSEQESKCETPEYYLCQTDKKMVESAFASAEKYHTEYHVERGRILIVSTNPELTKQICAHNGYGRSVVLLKSKNDMKSVQNALNSHCFVLGDMDCVGGLEFDAVYIVGVDKGRVPPEDKNMSSYVRYVWHNRMYVAVTRAKYAVKMWGNVNKGESTVLQGAVESQIIKKVEDI